MTMSTSEDLDRLAEAVLDACSSRGKRLATIESCTGGLIAALLTSVPGSSRVFDRGFITYSNDAKHELVGVPNQLVEKHGAVSEQVAEAMALGGLENSKADFALSVTGIAGPGGGTTEKPVGLVYIGCAARMQPTPRVTVSRFEFSDSNRNEIRNLSARAALEMLMSLHFREHGS